MPKNFWQKLPRPILALAPMVGISDSAYRQLARQWGADVVYTEMIAAEALIRNVPKALRMMGHTKTEYPLVVQIMGNKPETIAQAARIVQASGASGLDINFGCPAHKIARNYCGVMLMRDLDLSYKIISAALEAVDIPVSLKMRISISKTDNQPPGGYREKVTIIDFLEKINDLPVAALMVHGRSFEDPFDGAINLDLIRRVKEKFTRGPVLANGGVTTIESAKDILEQTGADGLGLARSTLGKPWVFQQIKDYLANGKYDEVDWLTIKKAMLQHSELFQEFYSQKYFEPMRRHLTHYIKGRPDASHLRQILVKTNSVQDVATILENN